MNLSLSAALPRVSLLLALALSFALFGCSKEEEPAPATPGAASSVPEAAAPVAAPVPTETPAEIAQRADAAVDAQRLFAPQGDNAFELYLRVLEAEPEQPLARNALTDLFPYAVMHVEQRLAANDPDDAERVLAMMERANAEAPALPRLRTALTDSRTRSVAAEAAELQRTERAALAAQQAAQQAAQPAAQPAPAAVPAPTTPGPSATPPPRATPTPAPSVPAPAPEEPEEPAPAPSRPAGSLPPVVSQASPRYPPLALRRRVEGFVEVQFTVLANGSVTDVSVARSEPRSMFDREAISAMQRWKFRPQPGAEPVRGRRTFDFKLAEE